MSLKGYFGSRTKLEKGLILSLIGLCIVVIVLFVCLFTPSDSYVCKEPQCIRAAIHILDTVDPQVNPCEDFYQFACGTFLKNAFVNGQPNTLTALAELAKNQLKNIVMETTNETELPRTLVMQRRFYRACTNTTAIEEDKDKTILHLLDHVTGGWPIVKTFNWIEQDFEWSNATLRARELGLYGQFFFNVRLYHNHTDGRSRVWIKPPSTEEVPSFHWDKQSLESKEKTVEIMADIAGLLGADSVSVMTQLRSTMTFAERLKETIDKYYNKNASAREQTRKVLTVKCLNHKFIKIDWPNFLRNITNLSLTGNDEVVFDVDEYFNDLYYLILRTPRKIQANYMAWAIISTNIHYMSQKVRDKYDEISKYSNNTKVDSTPRSAECFKLSKGLFGSVAEAEYVRRYTTEDKKVYIKEMISYIKKEMEESLKVTPWIDATSRTNAQKQLKNISEAIGWVDLAFDIEKLDKITGFDKLTLPSDNVVDMARMAVKADLDNYYRQIQIKSSKLNRMAPNVDVNAYFSREINLLILPASILQGHLFDTSQPHYMNYGALGSVIGHELTHGFSVIDDYVNTDLLWTNKSRENFENASKCLVTEYEKFQKEIGQQVENDTSLEENLADFTGVNIAYTAYLNWVKEHGREKSLPGVKYTPKQIFWIMASTYMCHEPRLSRQDMNDKDYDNSHGIPVFRVVGRLRNSPYFAKDFNCPEESKMNEKDKCRVYW